MWSKEFPTEPGWYWFWGRQFKAQDVKLAAVHVRQGGNSLVMVCNGSFMYKAEVGDTHWFKPMNVPSPEELDLLT